MASLLVIVGRVVLDAHDCAGERGPDRVELVAGGLAEAAAEAGKALGLVGGGVGGGGHTLGPPHTGQVSPVPSRQR